MLIKFVSTGAFGKWLTNNIDALIPGVFGLLLSMFPHLFCKKTGNKSVDAANSHKYRMIGLVLVTVGLLYFGIRRAS